MKKFILGVAIVLAVFWVYLICINYSTTSNFVLPFGKGEITLKSSWLLLGFGIFTAIIDCLSALWFFISKTDINKNYQLKMDKLSVQSDSDKTQVKVLENKIKTLETAIEKLTKEKNV